jgi:hypothetical protein
MLRCKEVTRLYASDELAGASTTTRLGVRMHLMFCRHCSRYVRELTRIREAARALARGPSMPDAKAEEMVRRAMAEGDKRSD